MLPKCRKASKLRSLSEVQQQVQFLRHSPRVKMHSMLVFNPQYLKHLPETVYTWTRYTYAITPTHTRSSRQRQTCTLGFKHTDINMPAWIQKYTNTSNMGTLTHPCTQTPTCAGTYTQTLRHIHALPYRAVRTHTHSLRHTHMRGLTLSIQRQTHIFTQRLTHAFQRGQAHAHTRVTH